jgi:hypothetical protein
MDKLRNVTMHILSKGVRLSEHHLYQSLCK